MIYDCFTFFNELDLLEIRLNVLKDVVDKFVLVEARQTHTGKPKPLYYEDNKSRYAAFNDRIIHIVIDSFPEDLGAWGRENFQRNAIIRGLTNLGLDDKVMISDLDEIPRPEIIQKYSSSNDVFRFNMISYGFYLNFVNLRWRNMYGTKMLPYGKFVYGFDGVQVHYDEFMPEEVNKGTTATKIRRRDYPRKKGGEIIVRNAGWHFSCLGGAKAMLIKMRSVAPHHDFDPDDPKMTEESVAKLLAKGKGPALKVNCFGVRIGKSFPEYIQNNLNKYSSLIFPITPEYMRSVFMARVFRTIQGRLIQFCEWVMPSRLHYFLHVLRMKLLRA